MRVVEWMCVRMRVVQEIVDGAGGADGVNVGGVGDCGWNGWADGQVWLTNKLG
jgi:hypothetical protein